MWQADLHGVINFAQTVWKCMQLVVLLRARRLVCPRCWERLWESPWETSNAMFLFLKTLPGFGRLKACNLYLDAPCRLVCSNKRGPLQPEAAYLSFDCWPAAQNVTSAPGGTLSLPAAPRNHRLCSNNHACINQLTTLGTDVYPPAHRVAAETQSQLQRCIRPRTTTPWSDTS